MTTKLWGQQNYKDAQRDTWKMGVYRSLKTVVQLLFKLRYPQKNNGISPVEHSSTTGATIPGINTWWATSSLLKSPLSQMAICSTSSRLLLFLCWIHPPFPIPAPFFLTWEGVKYSCRISWDILTPGVLQGAGWQCSFFAVWTKDDLEVRKWTQRDGAGGARGSAHVLWLSTNKNQNSREKDPPHNNYS